jgi:hypothetical protein
MEPIALMSPVSPTLSPLRRLLPIQSWHQGISIASLLLIVFLMDLVILRLLGVKHPSPIVIGSFGGALPSLYLALPGRFKLKSRAEARHLLDDIENAANSLGYRVRTVESPGQVWRYRLNHPRWMRWRENEIEIRLRDEHSIEVLGPKKMLRVLRERLARLDGYTTASEQESR